MRPDAVAAGTVKVRAPEADTFDEATLPLSVMLVPPTDASKFAPDTATEVAAEPFDGVKEKMAGTPGTVTLMRRIRGFVRFMWFQRTSAATARSTAVRSMPSASSFA